MAGEDNRYNRFTRNANTAEESNTTYKYAAFLPIPVVLSLILFLIGFVTPGWSGMKIDGTFYGSGLWYDYVCHVGSDCETKEFAHMVVGGELAEKAAEKSVLKYRVMACFALVLQINATILTLLARVPKTNFKQYLFTFISICDFCLFLSAVFSLVTSGMHAHQIIKAYNVYKKYKHLFVGESSFTFPYCLFLFGIGGIISALTMLFIMRAFCSKRMTVNRPIESTIQMSTRAVQMS
ncbi:hypothetical protein MAR_008210 [Mya arenaria]|uniref:Uncharacterized protein n=1 Tax=Mya arenaria TaxID=6604 RepID=A0ABY7DXY8_MYAAR|nr:uncharacterized protein LOC128232793 [Mya arenaria]WAR01652.1 hypothetical protein MAR_008210 [Mya arenaria]